MPPALFNYDVVKVLRYTEVVVRTNLFLYLSKNHIIPGSSDESPDLLINYMLS